uniref:Uncharacterized protein n=1 Tax=Cryptomonas curvata TaxID=233186 RepID=A0A7S0N2A3_9CRYP|mmetsp:Transcript_58454/g.122099  ORF Transcript_58454/g.122099 Transcript_58454/m.122099 type:complete len:122 (+) Transcript_58454:109-474(+)
MSGTNSLAAEDRHQFTNIVWPYAITHVSSEWAFGSNAGLFCFWQPPPPFKSNLLPQIILSQKGVDKNPRTLQGNTPLHLAALNNREPAIKLLVNNGVDLDCKNNMGLTPAVCDPCTTSLDT